jgi:hypothetical protein
MKPGKNRPKLKSITIELEDGRKRVLQGEELADPNGGTLVWNDYGAHQMMKSAYEFLGEKGKAARVEEVWNGSGTPAAQGVAESEELPSVMTKPQCFPEGWP